MKKKNADYQRGSSPVLSHHPTPIHASLSPYSLHTQGKQGNKLMMRDLYSSAETFPTERSYEVENLSPSESPSTMGLHLQQLHLHVLLFCVFFYSQKQTWVTAATRGSLHNFPRTTVYMTFLVKLNQLFPPACSSWHSQSRSFLLKYSVQAICIVS